jgi:hypothetical protein
MARHTSAPIAAGIFFAARTDAFVSSLAQLCCVLENLVERLPEQMLH